MPLEFREEEHNKENRRAGISVTLIKGSVRQKASLGVMLDYITCKQLGDISNK